ncbi:MAG TPA: DUF1345 domain-containing protein [Streptosporangiaceae bacterium]|nr:DUF1345 domain-containing protein [Streptosporangiaceae bacterium]
MVSSNGAGRGERMRAASAGQRVTVATIGGVVAGAIVSLVTVPSAAILAGWDVAVVIYLAWVWIAVWRLDPGSTARLAKREDPSSAVAELVVLGAGTAMLAAVGFALVRAGQATGGMKAFLVTLGVLSVVLSWTVVHTVYALRYAKAYYSEPAGGIEFNETEPPTYTDFAYFAFTIGMTFQVSDTNITAKAVRRITLHHALLSYLFGAVLLGLVINVVATLLK